MTSFLTILHGQHAINSGKHCQADFAYRCFLRSFHNEKIYDRNWNAKGYRKYCFSGLWAEKPFAFFAPWREVNAGPWREETVSAFGAIYANSYNLWGFTLYPSEDLHFLHQEIAAASNPGMLRIISDSC